MLDEVTKIGIAGDWHGNVRWAESVIFRMGSRGDIKHLFQVGDLGYGFPDSDEFLDEINSTAQSFDIMVYAVMGNHDGNTEWRERIRTGIGDRHEHTGGVHTRTNIVLLPVTARFSVGGRTVQVAGGAASIDRAWRTPGVSWWPDEILTDEEVDNIADDKVDILLTHDASEQTPFGFNLITDLDSHINRQRIDRVLRKTMPEVHFHGHYHQFYDWVNYGFGHVTQTYGLNMDGAFNSQGVLDLETLTFEWKN